MLFCHQRQNSSDPNSNRGKIDTSCKILNIIGKSEFMDSNLLQCDTLVTILLLVAVALWAIDPH